MLVRGLTARSDRQSKRWASIDDEMTLASQMQGTMPPWVGQVSSNTRRVVSEETLPAHREPVTFKRKIPSLRFTGLTDRARTSKKPYA